MKRKLEELKNKNLDELTSLLPSRILAHSKRVAICCAQLAGYASDVISLPRFENSADLAAVAYFGGLCHDIGKLLIEEDDKEDYVNHPQLGLKLLLQNSVELFEAINQRQMVLEMTRYHHERADGKGFPYGLNNRNIPLCAAICTVADRLDNLIYGQENKSLSPQELLQYFLNQVGQCYTSAAVSCFELALPTLNEYYVEWNKEKSEQL